jgi:hypothetical protein
MELRRLLGRTRIAANYVLGRQPMRRHVTAYDDDLWIVSYPRSGNTWTRFLIANLIANGEPVDWTNIEQRVPDIHIGYDPELRAIARPRYLKSHEPYRPEYRRVLLIVRDPRDVAVSYYHYSRKRKETTAKGDIADFVETFLAGRVDDYGNWGENVGSWLGARQGTPNFWLFRYEDLVADPVTELKKIADSLQLNSGADSIRRAVENSDADEMRRLESAQQGQHKMLRQTRSDIPFVRAAKSGGWQDELPPESARQIEAAWADLMRKLQYLK